MNKMGAKIKTLRKNKGFTLEQLGEFAGISKGYLWELENKKTKPLRPSANKIASLADALGVGMGYLMNDDLDNDYNSRERAIDERFYADYRKLYPEARRRLRQIARMFRGVGGLVK